MQSIFLQVYLDDAKARGLLDTGAQASWISDKLLSSCNLTLSPGSDCFPTTVGGHYLRCIGTTSCTLRFGKRTWIPVALLVVEGISPYNWNGLHWFGLSRSTGYSSSGHPLER